MTQQNQLAPSDRNNPEMDPAIARVVMEGDLSRLTDHQKIQYYNHLCLRVGIDPAFRPFDYLRLNGKLVLYANKGCAEQLREKRQVSFEPLSEKTENDILIIVTKATMPGGRTDIGRGAVSLTGLKGQDLANAWMKCETKSKRRATLSICGLNMLDESELDGVPPPRIYADQPGDDDGVEQGPDARQLFTRGKFSGYGPEEKDVISLRNWVAQVEERLANPKKPLSEEDRKEWEWNVELAAGYIAKVENSGTEDFTSWKGDDV